MIQAAPVVSSVDPHHMKHMEFSYLSHPTEAHHSARGACFHQSELHQRYMAQSQTLSSC